MIWTLILSFNSSVWLHLTLYIAWEQSNIPQHSSTLACWDTLHLLLQYRGQEDEKAKKIQLSNVFPFALWSQSLIFLGVQKVGEKFSSRLLSFPSGFPDCPNSSWGVWSWNLLKGFALLSSQVIWGGFWGFPGFAAPLSHLLFLPLVPRSSHPRRELLEWGLTGKAGLVWFRNSSGWELGRAQEKLLACSNSLPHPREAASAHSSIRRKLGAFLSLNSNQAISKALP